MLGYLIEIDPESLIHKLGNEKFRFNVDLTKLFKVLLGQASHDDLDQLLDVVVTTFYFKGQAATQHGIEEDAQGTDVNSLAW